MKEKSYKKVQGQPDRSARLSGQRLHISHGAVLTGEVIVSPTIGLVDEVATGFGEVGCLRHRVVG